MLLVGRRRLLSGVSSTIRFLFLDLTCLLLENVLSHTYALPNVECIFGAKFFSFGNPSLLNKFYSLV